MKLLLYTAKIYINIVPLSANITNMAATKKLLLASSKLLRSFYTAISGLSSAYAKSMAR
jgi:hypothetical protein